MIRQPYPLCSSERPQLIAGGICAGAQIAQQDAAEAAMLPRVGAP